MPDTPELLPCPFCGEMPKLVKMFDGRTRTIEIQPNCIPGKCHKRGVVTTTTFEELRELAESEAIAAWNTRADDAELTALRASVAELEAQQQWIPVTERLPEAYVDIWVTDGESVEPGYFTGYVFFVENQIWNKAATHWQPKPHPPAKREEVK